MFLGSLYFVDQNRSPAKSNISVPNYKCAPF